MWELELLSAISSNRNSSTARDLWIKAIETGLG
jgi:hypothetical protein